MARLLNAQDFIRALKASSDPPHAGGPFKVEIARQAWDTTSLYIPNKAEAITDWLLSTMLKDKSRQRYALSFPCAPSHRLTRVQGPKTHCAIAGTGRFLRTSCAIRTI